MSYNPIPPRVWSRVQNQCTYTDASNNSDINYNQVFIPLTGQTVTQAQANYEDKLIYKGNILQYKGNSSRLTKSQKYTQLAKGFGPNRTKVFATQSQTYTNPNTTGLQRINTQTYPYPNPIVGAPNNISGPYQYNVPNPNGCPGVSLQDGGTLVCGTFINPCTGDIIKQGVNPATICNPASASDVPGSSILCWNNNVQTWFPKPRYVMNNSTDKWPVNYKGLVSAITPSSLTLIGVINNCETITLSWNEKASECIPISSYNIYQNGVLIQNVPFTTKSITVSIPSCINYSFYVTALSSLIVTGLSSLIESEPSNIIYGVGNVTYNITAPINTIITQYTNNGYNGIVFDVNASYSPSGPTIGSCRVNFCLNVNANILIVGGGGGGAAGDDGTSLVAGGGGAAGGAITYITNYTLPGNTNIDISIGGGGFGRTPGNGGFGAEAGTDGGDSSLAYLSYLFLSDGGGEGLGDGTTIGRGGGLGGSSSEGNAPMFGGGGGGGGGAYQQSNPSGGVTFGGPGGSGQPVGTNPGITGSNASGTTGGNGGASALTTVTIPFTPVPTSINLGGGGGGGGSVSGGRAGNGTGGSGGTNSGANYGGGNALSGISNASYGGGGGGGGINFNSALNVGGNGGNGTVMIWWQTC